MARICVFADEAGDFNFSTTPGASRYFILTTVTVTDLSVGADLLDLRRQLAWEGADLRPEGFHATYDKQAVRDRVFEVLARGMFRVDATILEKRKAQPHLTIDEIAFYQLAWYMHFRSVAPQIAGADDELLVVAASLGTNRRRAAFFAAVQNVVLQTSPTTAYQTLYWPAASDPCLWAADYCSWAIQRKWERSDERSYALIRTKVRSEFQPFRRGTT
jgi:hypothetical protein